MNTPAFRESSDRFNEVCLGIENRFIGARTPGQGSLFVCLLYTSDAADE